VSTAHVSPVHGGLAAPVDRLTSPDEAAAWSDLPTLDVVEVDRTTLYRIADGTLSPLEGPMGEADYRSVLERGAIERDGKLWAWTIPIVLPVTEVEKPALGTEVALAFEGEVFGKLEVDSVFAWDKPAFVKAVYGTERMDHPGARLWTEDPRETLVGGRITLVPFEDDRPFADRVMSPTQTRALIEDAGFEQTVAFQTRNPLHRAHEYALVYGAESILRAGGRKTGVVLNPLVGQLKGDDVPAATRMQTYEALVDGKFLGQGDMDEELWEQRGQDLNDQLHLIGLDMRMYYGGPREAVMHAIYRQNYGFSDLVIGRKHADAPYEDGSPIWGDFDAQQVFQELAGELHLRPCNVGFAAYYESLGRVDLTENHPDEKPVAVSGTKVREQLKGGEAPDPRIMRPETAQILIEAYRGKA
ncbi:MAG: sulfate adenylyltransferase, partial [Thermoanaerobaculia bacterium]|nr:sulfate adenylyltransferase [Thermoanaerobaculia bacterium]